MMRMFRIFPSLMLWTGAGVFLWVMGQPVRVGLFLAGVTILAVAPSRILERARTRAGKPSALTLTFDDLAILHRRDWLQLVPWFLLGGGLFFSSVFVAL